MKHSKTLFVRNRLGGLLAAALFCSASAGSAAEPSADREPPVIDPGPVGGPPSDALVLLDGTDLARWKGGKGGEAKWTLVDGAMEVNGTGNILTKEEFGNVQLHVEWAAPAEVKGSSPGRYRNIWIRPLP